MKRFTLKYDYMDIAGGSFRFMANEMPRELFAALHEVCLSAFGSRSGSIDWHSASQPFVVVDGLTDGQIEALDFVMTVPAVIECEGGAQVMTPYIDVSYIMRGQDSAKAYLSIPIGLLLFAEGCGGFELFCRAVIKEFGRRGK